MTKKFTVSHLSSKLACCLLLLLSFNSRGRSQQFININKIKQNAAKIIVAAERTEKYVPLLKNKKVAVVANQTSLIKKTHLVDSLLHLGITIEKVFCPEHGFRGIADAGEKVQNYIDKKTLLPIVSLYGVNKKPAVADLKNIDVVLFDMQDVGARFYTYISTMHYMMEACAENHIPFIVLDRPNPNGFYVDGPILEETHRSFVGMHPVPIVHGLTIGEYAQMINGEEWLNNAVQCNLTIIPCDFYSHKDYYSLPVKPSPNLPSMPAVYLYPSLCLFEGTVVSVGRGTNKPFEQVGAPEYKSLEYSFTPKSIVGASKNPPYKGVLCYGYLLSSYGQNIIPFDKKINLFWLMNLYQLYPDKSKFFIPFFVTLCGTKKLKEQIENNVSEDEIRKSWEPGLLKYKEMRKKYLLYEDFE